MEALERSVKALDLEWNEWFDKYRRLYARLSKRVEREEAPQEPLQLNGQPASHHTPNPLALAILKGRQT